ncbi:MAG: ABC transporter ATP-binding protein [bacterium JZ-2024 1]
MHWIEARNITKKFNRFVALDNFSLNVEERGITGLIGLNGAGKTTFLKILLGLLQAEGGEILLFGKKPEEPESRRNVGYLPEQLSLPPRFTPEECIAFFASLHGKKMERRETRGLLEQVHLEETCWNRPVQTLSKGQYQRVGLATALATGSSFLILDEPTSGLDAEGREEIKRLLRRVADSGISILLTSHILADIQEICDRICLIHRGKNRFSGSVQDFLTLCGELSLKEAFLSFTRSEG